ncbi:GGDEF domain-containing protein [Hoeflea sp.]|uniref:GGDEF domain-containing protein n=1 Tax=Hoeflea sp. TaxID=1940281 RepID=UPI003B51ED21
MNEIIGGLLQGIGIIAIASMTHEAALNYCATERCKLLATTLVFTFGIAGSMMVPFELTDGLFFDLRHVFLVLVASFGGPVATLVAAATAIGIRLFEGGAGLVPGVAGILISAGVGLLFAFLWPLRNMSPLRLVAIGIGSNVAMVSVFLLPWPIAVTVLAKIGVPLAAANFVGVLIAASVLNHRSKQVTRVHSLLDEVRVDGLTGLANRRSFDKEGEKLARTTEQRGKPCAVMMIDIDHFKSVNDTFGHAAGDEVLKHVAAIVSENARLGDLIARYGGEEMALVLPNLDGANAHLVADRIRNAVENAATTVRGLPLKVTVSIGFAPVGSTEDAFSVALRAADEALYAAKNEGRNRVISAVAA